MSRLKKTENLNKKREPEEGTLKGLVSSFKASAKGVNAPHIDGLLGPRRSIM